MVMNLIMNDAFDYICSLPSALKFELNINCSSVPIKKLSMPSQTGGEKQEFALKS